MTGTISEHASTSVRQATLTGTKTDQPFDLVVIGGGATGLGVALDAVHRGYRVALFERYDFAKGTSSRSTKLLHGGVRYLAQGNVSLVREALHERSTLMAMAPHLAQPLAFLMPCYRALDLPFYWAGLKAYDTLAGRKGLGKTALINPCKTRRLLPNIRQKGLKGSVQYWDGQFDDARFALAMARTAAQKGALIANYCEVQSIEHADGRVQGVTVRDVETNQTWSVPTRCVVNATGVWVDQLRQIDEQAAGQSAEPMVAPSQGIHIVLDREFMPSDQALIIPKTSDGRVLFALPWLGKIVLGTTDTPRDEIPVEPKPLREEIDFLIREAANYLQKAPTLQDIRSLWVGLRPLVKPINQGPGDTKSISREHTILSSPSGMVTVTGGKWTTYRVMAQDTLAHCIKSGVLKPSTPSHDLIRLVGAQNQAVTTRKLGNQPDLLAYGDEANQVQALPGADREIAYGLTEAMVRFAARYEYARTVEDVLARRSRLLFLDAESARQCAQIVADILQEETQTDPQLDQFMTLSEQYLHIPV